jgi:hypothetical protein
MRTFTVLPAIAFVAGIRAQTGEFEAPDFNVTEALIANGINVTALPELAPLVERSSLSGCSIAVSSLSKRSSNAIAKLVKHDSTRS